MRSGKRLGASRQLITLGFHEPPLRMFPVDRGHTAASRRNEIVIDFANPGSITTGFLAKEPGAQMRLGSAEMTFRDADFFGTAPDLDQIQAERLALGQHAVQRRPVQQGGKHRVRAAPLRHQRRERRQQRAQMAADLDRVPGSRWVHAAIVVLWQVNQHHRDPVTTSHLPGGEPGSVAKARTAARGRARRLQGDAVTTPASGADSAADLFDYAPIPRSALGPALNDQRYYVGRVERNLYWVTDGIYHSAFLTTRDGVVLFDAPPSIGPNLQRAVDEIAAANGVPNTVTHLVYSHHHADHAGAASLFDGDVVRIGHEETRRLLLRDNDPARPAPEITFADRYTLEVGGERAELAWHGPNHSPDNIYIHFPDHDTLMLIDVVNAGWVPIYNVNLSEDVPGYIAAPATALSYPWTHFICGHLGRLATRDDVAVHQQYIADIEASAREALASVDPVPFYVAATGKRLGRGQSPPRRRHRTGGCADRRQVHRRAGRRRRRGVHLHHHVPDHAVAAPRQRHRG